MKLLNVSCVLCHSINALTLEESRHMMTSVTADCDCCCVWNCKAHRMQQISYCHPPAWNCGSERLNKWLVVGHLCSSIWTQIAWLQWPCCFRWNVSSVGFLGEAGLSGEYPLCLDSAEPRQSRTASHWVYVTEPLALVWRRIVTDNTSTDSVSYILLTVGELPL